MGNVCCFSNRVDIRLINKTRNLIEKHEFNIAEYNPVFLGKGTSGNTYKITINSVLFTCKRVNKKRTSNVYDEILILKAVEYDNYLPHFYKCIETKKHFNIIYKYVDGVELLEVLINSNDEVIDAKSIITEIALGLQALFKYNYIHLDIKPENIIVEKKNPVVLKLIDLEFCRKINGTSNSIGKCGTIGYFSPEVYLYGRYFHNTDVWSLGIIFHILLTGRKIFQYNSFAEELESFTELNKKCLLDEEEDAVDLLDKMLTKNPTFRISINDILEHKYAK